MRVFVWLLSLLLVLRVGLVPVFGDGFERCLKDPLQTECFADHAPTECAESSDATGATSAQCFSIPNWQDASGVGIWDLGPDVAQWFGCWDVPRIWEVYLLRPYELAPDVPLGWLTAWRTVLLLL